MMKIELDKFDCGEKKDNIFYDNGSGSGEMSFVRKLETRIIETTKTEQKEKQ